jgi:hypothetical protein
MPAAPYREGQAMSARDADHRAHVGRRGAPRDEPGSTVDRAIPHPTGVVVPGVVRLKERAA